MALINWFTESGLHIEFLACVILTVYWMPRREHFQRNVAAALAGWVLCLVLLHFPEAEDRIVKIVKFFSLCSIYAFLIMIPFDIGISDAFFYMAIAGTAQHLIYKMSDFFAFLAVPGYPMIVEKSVTYTAFYIVLLLIYALTGSKIIAKKKSIGLNKYQSWALVIGFFLISGVYENVYKYFMYDILPALYIFMIIFEIITTIFVLVLQIVSLATHRSEQDIAFMHSLLREQRLQLDASKENVEMISMKMHDLKQMITSLGSQITAEQMDALYSAVSTYDRTARTGNETLDILLTEKSLICENNGIQLSYIANGQLLDFVSDSDLYALVGNILNNAIEAVLKIEDREKRIIDMRIQEQTGCAVILVENSVGEAPIIRNGRIETSKADKQQHGYGLKSIKVIAKKYKGSSWWNYENQQFTVCVMLPLGTKEKSK